MAKWFTVEDGRVKKIQSKPIGSGKWIKAPEGKPWKGNSGDKYPEWFDEHGYRIPDKELVKQGKRIDHTERRWYAKDNPSETKFVYSMDEEAGEEWTDIPPLSDEIYQKFDKQNKKWIIDTDRKEKADKERKDAEKKQRRIEIESRLDVIDIRRLRPIEELSTDPGSEGAKAALEKLNNEKAALKDELANLKTEEAR
ncbi:MAG: hypothetical protein FWF38_03750 [Spirochaetaceae bacterium]|nr:hypothetical protein [Spirochaetaceae bacterium]